MDRYHNRLFEKIFRERYQKGIELFPYIKDILEAYDPEYIKNNIDKINKDLSEKMSNDTGYDIRFVSKLTLATEGSSTGAYFTYPTDEDTETNKEFIEIPINKDSWEDILLFYDSWLDDQSEDLESSMRNSIETLQQNLDHELIHYQQWRARLARNNGIYKSTSYEREVGNLVQKVLKKDITTDDPEFSKKYFNNYQEIDAYAKQTARGINSLYRSEIIDGFNDKIFADYDFLLPAPVKHFSPKSFRKFSKRVYEFVTELGVPIDYNYDDNE
jgi:hypothetical protein